MLQCACNPPAMSPAQSLHGCPPLFGALLLTWATAQTCLRDALHAFISCTGRARAHLTAD